MRFSPIFMACHSWPSLRDVKNCSRQFFYAALVSLLAGCQVFSDKPSSATSPETRLQGELKLEAGQLYFRPCQEQRRFVISDDGSSGIARGAAGLLTEGANSLFADLRGSLKSSSQTGVDGKFSPSLVYRLQAQGPGCSDINFKRTSLHASGQEPGWSVAVNRQGLVLNRQGLEPQALPYLEEQLPEGRLHLSSEANGQRLELWVAPQRCVDSMSGTVQHLSAELRLNGEVLRGCAYLGGARGGAHDL
jgi:putative lipoprotein